MKKAIIAALGLAATLGLSSCSTAASSGGSGQATNFTQLLPMIAIYVLLFAALYFFMIRPNSKKKKQEEQLRNSLEIGDELITIGGITGRVVSIKDDESFILETGPDRTKIQFQKWAISTITTEKELPTTNKKKRKDKEKADEK